MSKIDAWESTPLERAGREDHNASSEALFRLLAESNVSLGYALLSADARVIGWNSAAARMEGYTAAEVVGRPYSSIFSPTEVEQGEPERRLQFARSIGPFEQEGWRTRSDGSRYWGMVTVTVLKRSGEEFLGYLQIMRDLSERRAEAAVLRTSYDQLNSMMNATSDGALQLSWDWKILYGNKRAEELITDFEIGGPFWESFPSIVGTPIEDNLRRCMNERVTVVYENHFAPTNLWFRARAYPTQEGIGLFFSDITTEKTMQNKLALEQILREKRIEALSHMAGGLAHEINNPLAIIHARASDLCACVADDKPVAAETVRTACRSIVQSSDRAIRVLRALHGFAREASTDPMLTASASEILEQCVDLLEERFTRHEVELRLDLPTSLPGLVCRELQILQIVTNLLNNALDAAQQRPHGERWVWLRARECGETLQVDVVDSGPGIEAKFRAHVMDPFFATKVRGLGLGVGLSLSRTIAEEHGGDLSLVETEEYTTFRLTLPLTKERAPSDEPWRNGIDPTEGRELC